MSSVEFPASSAGLVAALGCEECGRVYYTTDEASSACPECGVTGPTVLSWDVWVDPERLCGSLVRVRYRRVGRDERAGGTLAEVLVRVNAAWPTHFVGETRDGEDLLVGNGDQPVILELLRSAEQGVAVIGFRMDLELVEECDRQLTLGGR